MDFLERLFGFAPDNGSGLWEAFMVLFPFMVALYCSLRKKRMSERSRM